MARVFETRVRVRYAETDQMGVVYHSNYLVWFEVGRVELLRELGFEYRHMEIDEDFVVAVVDARARYRAPARYDDELIVRTRVAHVRGSVFAFEYEVVRANDGLLLCDGSTTHVATTRGLVKRPIPEACAAAMTEAAK